MITLYMTCRKNMCVTNENSDKTKNRFPKNVKEKLTTCVNDIINFQ